MHWLNVRPGNLVQSLVHGILLHTLLNGFADPLACCPLRRSFKHATSRHLSGQHLEQHGITHHGAYSRRTPCLCITHGGTAGNVGSLLPCQRQLVLVREELGLLIFVNPSKRLPECGTGRQLIKAHVEHGLPGINPSTTNRACCPGRYRGPSRQPGYGLSGDSLSNLLGRPSFEHGCSDSTPDTGLSRYPGHAASQKGRYQRANALCHLHGPYIDVPSTIAKGQAPLRRLIDQPTAQRLLCITAHSLGQGLST